MSIRTELCQIRGEESRSLLYWKKNLPRDIYRYIYVVRVETDKSSSDYRTRSCMAWSMEQNWKKPLRRKKNKNGQTRSQKSIMLDEWEVSTSFIVTTKNTRKPLELWGEIWKGLWTRPCRAKTEIHSGTRKRWAELDAFRWWRGIIFIDHGARNEQGNWSEELWIHKATSGTTPAEKITKTSQAKETTRWHIAVWFTSFCSYASSNKYSGCEGSSG